MISLDNQISEPVTELLCSTTFALVIEAPRACRRSIYTELVLDRDATQVVAYA